MGKTKKPIWQFPWQYKESIAIVAGLLLVGFLLQITLGNFNFYLLHAPVNILVGALVITAVTVLSFSKKNHIIHWLSGIPLSVTLIGALCFLSAIMGLTPQFAKINTHLTINWGDASFSDMLNYLATRIGLKQMTSSWAFVLIYSFTLVVLGLIIARRLHRFKRKDYAFYLNHIGLWLFLFAAGFGAADMLRYVMYVEEGETEWRVYDRQENVLELDIAIQLHDFIMEEYPPKLAIINKYTGDVQSENKPAYYQIDEQRLNDKLAGWNLQLDEYIHEAVRKTDTSFQAIPMTGSMPAARVTLTNQTDNRKVSGWLTCGSIDQYVMPLEIDSTYSLVMTKPEAKRFASDITVLTKDNPEPIHTTLEVNSPLKMGPWMIYQYDYDHNMGKASRMSGFELVYDPWLPFVYIGIGLMALGAFCMVVSGSRNKQKEKQ